MSKNSEALHILERELVRFRATEVLTEILRHRPHDRETLKSLEVHFEHYRQAAITINLPELESRAAAGQALCERVRSGQSRLSPELDMALVRAAAAEISPLLREARQELANAQREPAAISSPDPAYGRARGISDRVYETVSCGFQQFDTAAHQDNAESHADGGAAIVVLYESDHLAGFLSRSMFIKKASKAAMPNPRRFQTALILIDIDRMRDINQRLGTSIGDKVIHRLADLVKSSLPAAVLGRWDDTVAVIVDGMDDREIETKLKSVAQSLYEMSDESTCLPTFCAGVSVLYEGGHVEDWISHAEHLVQSGKQKGPAWFVCEQLVAIEMMAA